MSEQPVVAAEDIPNYRTPEQEGAIKGVNAPRAHEVPASVGSRSFSARLLA